MIFSDAPLTAELVEWFGSVLSPCGIWFSNGRLLMWPGWYLVIFARISPTFDLFGLCLSLGVLESFTVALIRSELISAKFCFKMYQTTGFHWLSNFALGIIAKVIGQETHTRHKHLPSPGATSDFSRRTIYLHVFGIRHPPPPLCYFLQFLKVFKSKCDLLFYSPFRPGVIAPTPIKF